MPTLKTPFWDKDGRLYRPGSEIPAEMLKPGAQPPQSDGKGASLNGVDFASEGARSAAEEAGLTAEDFRDAKASGAGGFTKPDVRALIDAKG